MRTRILPAVLVVSVALLGVVVWRAVHPVSESAPVADVARVESGQASRPERPRRPQPYASRPAPALLTAEQQARRAELAEVVGRPAPLTREQVETAFAVLQEIAPTDAEQGGHVAKNAVMNALNRQAGQATNALRLYAVIYRDPAQDVVIRDYALQHVYELYAQLEAGPLRQEAVELLHAAAAQSDSSIAGTAILALARLAATDPTVPQSAVSAAAFALAENRAANASARISALQVIGQFDAPQAVPLLVQTVKDESSIPLQLSAIGALGQVGGKNEVSLLRTIAEGENARLKPAAAGALRKIEQRLGTL